MEGNKWKTVVRLNTGILTEVKVQSINYVAPTDIALNKLRGNEINLGDVYVSDVTHDEILETIFSRK